MINIKMNHMMWMVKLLQFSYFFGTRVPVGYISPDLDNLYMMHTFPYATYKKLHGAYILNYART